MKKINVIGLGHVGLPTACLLAKLGFAVHGVDIDQKKIEKLLSLSWSTPERDLQNLVHQVIKSGALTLSSSISLADVFMIAVPTPLRADKQPDISFVEEALKSLQPQLRKNNLVIIESTCPIGTTNHFAKKLQSSCPGVLIAYCPERILPGNTLHELIHNERIVGGVDALSAERARIFFESFVKAEVLMTDACTAEAVKLAENTYRDINIAYANELSMIADYLNINISEVIRLANKHPRVNILQPGPGVGGHCIAIDPWFLASAAPSMATLITRAREVNQAKTEWVIKKIRTVMKKHNAKIVACLGLSYKPNVADIRESAALAIVQNLEVDFEVLRVDPYIENTIEIFEAIERSDIIVGLVAHDTFKEINSSDLLNKIWLDFAGIIDCEPSRQGK